MTKRELEAAQENGTFEEYLQKYEGVSLSVLIDKLNELEEMPGSDELEIEALKQLIKDMSCDMNPFQID